MLSSMRAWPALVVLVSGCDLVFPVGGGFPGDAEPPDGPVVVVDADRRDAVGGDAVGGDAAGLDAAVGCPPSYGSVSGQTSEYRTVTASARPWLQAASLCVTDELSGSVSRTHLLVLDDDAERSALASLNPGLVVWIGASDRRTEGTFQWNTLEPIVGYPPPSNGPWGSGQPDDGGDGSGGVMEDCVLMLANADFVDADCGIAAAYVCECDLFPDAPTQY